MLATALALLVTFLGGDAPDAPFLTPVPWTQVKLADKFFRPLQERVRDVTHAHCRKMLEQARAFELIDRAAKGEGAPEWKRPVWNDSDVFKLVESMAYTLGTDPSPERDAEFDALVARFAAAQRDDGYLNSWFEVYAPQDRFKNLMDCHELYCAGHLIEAAVAHHQATGKQNLLDVALKYADLIDRRFRTDRDALAGYCGHPEIELALVRLADETGDARWFTLAQLLLQRRGSHYFAREHGTPDAKYEGEYFQDHRPLALQTKMVGHAVRAGYLWTGATDVAGRRGDTALLAAVDTVWRNTVGRRMFVTGGIGAAAANEGFTTDFDLPTATAYQETCASIAFALWNERLGRLKRDGKYHDLFERALLNAVLAGYSQDGCHFFYANPLASAGGQTRPEWYDCACCPNNVTRMLAGLGRFVASTSGDELWVHLPIAGTIDAVVGGKPVRLTIEGSYPWPGHGKITVSVKEPTTFTLRLRHPEWCNEFSLGFDDEPSDDLSTDDGASDDGSGDDPASDDGADDEGTEDEGMESDEEASVDEGTDEANSSELDAIDLEDNGYESVTRTWHDGETIDFELGASVRRLVADPRAENLRGQVALQYGPFLYCIEQCDYAEWIDHLFLPDTATLAAQDDDGARYRILRGTASAASPDEWSGGLYSEAPPTHEVRFRAIPYFAWDERNPGPMKVWLPTTAPRFEVRGLEQTARVAASFDPDDSTPEAVAEPIETRSSKDRRARLCHFSPHKGGTEWIEYAWNEPASFRSTRVFWFDEGSDGHCRLPKSARVLWRDGADWKPVADISLPVAPDRWCELEFPAVTTTALRLEIVQPDGAATGVLSWNVFDD